MTDVDMELKPEPKSFKRRNDKRKLEPIVNVNLLEDDAEEALAKKLFGFKGNADSSSDSDSDDEPLRAQPTAVRSSVWHDDDDDVSEQIDIPNKTSALILKKSTDDSTAVSKQEYQQRLRAAFQRTHNAGKVPTWAQLDGATAESKTALEDSDDEVEAALAEMTKTTGKYVERDVLLPKGVLDLNLMPDITVGHTDKRNLKVIRFHKTKPVVLTAGESGYIQLFQVDSEVKKEHFLQNVHFSKFPIKSMDFLAGGNSVICGSSRQEYFMRYELEKGTATQSCLPISVQAQNVGKFAVSSDGSLLAMAGHTGQVHLLSAVSMEHIKTMAVPAEVASLSFMPGTNQEVWILTERGQGFIWDLKACSLHPFIDDGSVRGTTITLSREGNYVACGSNTGIVNIYDPAEARISKTPKPVGTISSLLTACDSVAFSHDCEIMAATSAVKSDQVKLMHMRSKTMFSNFPKQFEKLNAPECIEFSPHSGYMAIGTGNRLRMYRVGHYEGY